MEVELFREVARFLSKLEPIQVELEDIYEQRLTAVTQSDSKAMVELVETERPVTDRLKKHLRVRSSILSRARQAGLKSTDLKTLLSSLAGSSGVDPQQHQQVSDWMKRVDERSWKLRRASYVIWYVVRRHRNSFPTLRQMVAGASHDASLEDPERRSRNTGGNLIDASV